MTLILGFVAGILTFSILRILIGCLYTVRPDQRAVVTSFGAVQKLQEKAAPPPLSSDEKERYEYPQVRVVGPGGPYFKLPWQEVHKVSVATQAVDLVVGSFQGSGHDRSGHQGQPDDRCERADPISNQRKQSVPLFVRCRQPAGTRHGILRFGVAGENREFRRPERAEPVGRSGDRGRRRNGRCKPVPSSFRKAFRSTTFVRTCRC